MGGRVYALTTSPKGALSSLCGTVAVLPPSPCGTPCITLWRSLVILRLDRRNHSGLKMKKEFYVYILASKRNGTLYTGVTSDLIKRVWQHKNNALEGFTKKYHVHNLVYYEKHEVAESAIRREKRLKFWKRQWKVELIEKENPLWSDLYGEITGSCGQAAG